MGKVNEKLGTDYKLFNYYGAPDADRVIVAMGSICDVAEEVIDYLTAQGEKVGLVKVRLFRPWRADKLLEAIPATCKKIALLDRTKEPGAQGEPLYLDVVTSVANAGRDIQVIGGRYGLGSKDTPPASVFAVYNELKKDEMKRQFTIGIVDDVTNLSLPEEAAPSTAAEGTVECKFWGLGGDGTVGANKNSITPTRTFRLTSSTTPRRPAASPSAICASATSRSRARTTSTRQTSLHAMFPLT